MEMKFDGLAISADFHDKSLVDVNVFLNNVPSEAVVFLCLPADKPMSLTRDMHKKSLNVVVNNPYAICYFGDIDLNVFNVMTGLFRNAVFAFKKRVLDGYDIKDIYSFLHHLSSSHSVVGIGGNTSELCYEVKSKNLISHVSDDEVFNYTVVVPTKKNIVDVSSRMGIDYLRDSTCFLIHSDSGDGLARYSCADGIPTSIYTYGYDFNYSKIHNDYLMKYDAGDYCILANDDVELGHFPLKQTIMNLLVPFRFDDRLAVVGAKLYFPDGALQHVGVRIDRRLGAIHPGRGMSEYPGSEFFDTRNCVTFALVAIDVKKYRLIGGIDEMLPHDFNDIDYCLRCKKSGFNVLYNPQAVAIHRESETRKVDGKCGMIEETKYFKQKHKGLFA